MIYNEYKLVSRHVLQYYEILEYCARSLYLFSIRFIKRHSFATEVCLSDSSW